MRKLIVAGLALLIAAVVPASGHDPAPNPKNLCTNGGFEETEIYGGLEHPAGWFVMDPRDPHQAPISTDAHTGKRAGRLSTDAKTVVGMNWDCPGLVAGTVRFWFKALQSSVKGRNLIFFMIPMRAAQGMRLGLEIDPQGQASGRIGARVAPETVGDGRWHQAEFDFDFRDLHAAHSLFAPRINEFTPATGSGEMLFDDVEITAAP